MDARAEKRTYYRVAAGLMALLAATVAVSFVDLGPWNLAIALTIAVLKAGLVVFFFMELRASAPATQVIAAGGVLWLLLLIAGTLIDVMTRHPVILPMGG